MMIGGLGSYGKLVVIILAALIVGCGEKTPPVVVVYTALDRELSEPIFKKFTEETGILVRSRFATQSAKTGDLAQAILAERERPRCDVFWNDEMLSTLRLEREGLLRPYKSAVGEGFPASARSADGYWYGFASRARVLIVNTNQVTSERMPKSIRDLVDPQWRCGIAKPLFGTTATHAACLFATWGDDEAQDFFRAVRSNASIMGGNKQVAQAVGAGKLAFGLTDSSEVPRLIESRMPVTIVYPDQDEGQMGTLFIPNTVSIVQNSPNPEAAEKLVDYLLRPEVEHALAAGPSAQIPLRPGVAGSPLVKSPTEVRPMQVDWSAAAEDWSTAAEFLKAEFTVP